MPTVSIVMPAYNPGLFLPLAVDSVLAQTFLDWELIIVNDGSTSEFPDVARKHPAIQVLHQENAGPSVARNHGIAVAQGEYIAFLDADDLWLPTKLEQQLRVMEQDTTIGLCHTAFDMIDTNGDRTGPGFGKNIETYSDLLRRSCILTSSVLIRKECLTVSGLFDPKYRGPEDYEFFLRFARAFKTAFISECSVLYRNQENSISHNQKVMYRDVMQILRTHLAIAVANRDQGTIAAAREGMRRLRISYGCIAFDTCRRSLSQKDWAAFRSLYLRALWLSPQYVLKATASYLTGHRTATSEKVLNP